MIGLRPRRAAWRSAAAATLVFVLACAPGRRGAESASPSGSLPAAWRPGACFIADTSAPVADTIVAVGLTGPVDPALARKTGCDAYRAAPGADIVVLRLRPPAGVDLRDVLEPGLAALGGHRLDVVVTRDVDVLDYARRRGGHLVEALPWSATHVLLPARPAPAPTIPSSDEREALARDAVTAGAREAAPPFAWLVDPTCAAVPSTVPFSDASSVIAFAAGDATGRELAARIVALATMDAPPQWITEVLGTRSGRAPLRVLAVPADSIASALAGGRAIAAVTTIARDPRTRCGTRRDAPVPAGAIPLVDTREHAIVRRGSGAAFLVSPDGSLRFVRVAPR